MPIGWAAPGMALQCSSIGENHNVETPLTSGTEPLPVLDDNRPYRPATGRLESEHRLGMMRDFVNVLALNEQGNALVFEREERGPSVLTWRLVSENLNVGDDPITAVKQALFRQAGLQSNEWRYLGSYTVGSYLPARVGHFFIAQHARQITPPGAPSRIKWVTMRDLRYALLDGRLSAISHAMTVSIALLTMLR